jgi:hypothetical protein
MRALRLAPVLWVNVVRGGKAPEHEQSAPFPLRNPGLVTIPLSFVVGMVVSLLTKEKEAAENFDAMQHRLHLGPEADQHWPALARPPGVRPQPQEPESSLPRPVAGRYADHTGARRRGAHRRNEEGP